jgi:hypothetical protein
MVSTDHDSSDDDEDAEADDGTTYGYGRLEFNIVNKSSASKPNSYFKIYFKKEPGRHISGGFHSREEAAQFLERLERARLMSYVWLFPDKAKLESLLSENKSLAEHNSTRLTESTEETERSNSTRLTQWMTDILNSELFEKTPESVEECDKREKMLVKMMNAWCCYLDFHNNTQPFIAIRCLKPTITDTAMYYWTTFTINTFEKLLHSFEIMTYNRADEKASKSHFLSQHTYLLGRHYRPGDETINTFFPTKFRPEPVIKIESMKISKIWLAHPDKARCSKTTFDPTNRTSSKDALNLWAGFELPREAVRNYQDWAKIKWILNHIKVK